MTAVSRIAPHDQRETGIPSVEPAGNLQNGRARAAVGRGQMDAVAGLHIARDRFLEREDLVFPSFSF